MKLPLSYFMLVKEIKPAYHLIEGQKVVFHLYRDYSKLPHQGLCGIKAGNKFLLNQLRETIVQHSTWVYYTSAPYSDDYIEELV